MNKAKKNIRAIIPVAGIGTRLRPHTYTLPKVLLTVAGKPILGHILDKIYLEGIREATIVVGHFGEMVEEYVRKHHSNLHVDFILQDELLGLGHSIYVARETFDHDPIFIILGDTIFDVELQAVLNSSSTSLGVKVVDDPRRFGVAVLKNKYIERLVEKADPPVSNLALVGLYYIKHSALLKECIRTLIEEDIRTKNEYQLTDALQLMIERGERMTTFRVDGWFDCGKPETLLSTNQHLLNQKSTVRKIAGVVINPPVFISSSADIKNSIIGPYTTIADHSVIEDSVIRNSIVSQEAHVKQALLENSIIGNGAVIKGSYQRVNAGDSSEMEFV